MPDDQRDTSSSFREIGGDDYYETSSSDDASDADRYPDEICPKDPDGCDCPDRGRPTYRDGEYPEQEESSSSS